MKGVAPKMSWNRTIARVTTWIRPTVSALLLLLIAIGVVGFIVKWYPLVKHPDHIFADFYPVVDELFSLLLLYEILNLLRSLSPKRLIDVLLTILARQIILTQGGPTFMWKAVVFGMLFVLRLLWNRFSRPEDEHDD